MRVYDYVVLAIVAALLVVSGRLHAQAALEYRLTNGGLAWVITEGQARGLFNQAGAYDPAGWDALKALVVEASMVRAGAVNGVQPEAPPSH